MGGKDRLTDPFALAEYLRVTVIAREDILEARTVPARGGYSIEFNPNRPRNRVKYSICHELAHTLFPDCAERVRNRVTHRDMKGDEWQLEMLCNIGAAEMLMPVGSTPSLEGGRFTIDAIVEAGNAMRCLPRPFCCVQCASPLTNAACSVRPGEYRREEVNVI